MQRTPTLPRRAIGWFRVALATAVLGALGNGRPASAQASTPLAPRQAAAPQEETEEPDGGVSHEQRSRSHVLGLRYDIGSASAYGLGYLHVHDASTARGGIGVTTYYGYGVEGRLATDDHSRLDGGIVSATGRAGMWGHGGGLSIELLAGAGIGDGRAIPVGSVGAFYGLYFLELGYAYQAPIGFDRPAWCSSHQFAVRVHIPVHRYAVRTWDESPSAVSRSSR